MASTVKRDPTAAHFTFHDDPFLIPLSNSAKRSHALAQEAGRKAAKWIKDENWQLFQHQNAEPFIDAFVPKQQLKDATPVNQELLLEFINTIQITKAITVYQRLLTENIGEGSFYFK